MRKAGLGGTFWPDELQEGLLRAALLERTAALAAWTEIRQPLDLTELWDAEAIRLLPLVYRNLAAIGAEDPDLDRLKGVYRRSWYGNQLLLHRAAPAFEAMSGAGIDLLLLKGVPLALHYYGDLGARPMYDIDLLVRPTQASAALAMLASMGWVSMRDQSRDRIVESRTSDNLRHLDGGELDVHWSPSPFFEVRGVDDDPGAAMWQHSDPLEVNGLTVRMPGAVDFLLHVIVHGCWIESASNVRWAADAAKIIEGAGSQFDWSRLISEARSRQVVPVVHDALTYLERVLSVRVPAATLRELRSTPVSARERRTYKILSGDTRAPDFLGALPRTRAKWVYRSQGWSRSRRFRELPDHVRDAWGLPSTRDIPRCATQKAMRKIRRLPPTGYVPPSRRAKADQR